MALPCPKCHSANTCVADSRYVDGVTRRRMKCRVRSCGHRYSSVEFQIDLEKGNGNTARVQALRFLSTELQDVLAPIALRLQDALKYIEGYGKK
jgi:transcriptional regulator NrdR family protein